MATFTEVEDVPPCPFCGTWECTECGWKRHKANVTYDLHDCIKCGSTTGLMIPTRHRTRRQYEDHKKFVDSLTAQE